MTGYVKTESGGYKLWIGRRSLKKATYPGLLDNMVGFVFENLSFRRMGSVYRFIGSWRNGGWKHCFTNTNQGML